MIDFLYNLYREHEPDGIGMIFTFISILLFIIGITIPVIFIPAILFLIVGVFHAMFNSEIQRWIWNLYYEV